MLPCMTTFICENAFVPLADEGGWGRRGAMGAVSTLIAQRGTDRSCHHGGNSEPRHLGSHGVGGGLGDLGFPELRLVAFPSSWGRARPAMPSLQAAPRAAANPDGLLGPGAHRLRPGRGPPSRVSGGFHSVLTRSARDRSKDGSHCPALPLAEASREPTVLLTHRL